MSMFNSKRSLKYASLIPRPSCKLTEKCQVHTVCVFMKIPGNLSENILVIGMTMYTVYVYAIY